MESFSAEAQIRIIGVGDAGGSILRQMATTGMEGVEFICVNSDAQALRSADVWTPIEIGRNMPRRSCVGPSIEMIRDAAREDRIRIQRVMEGVDMVFVVAGMGGATGSGAAPVVAQVAQELGILTIGLVTTPFAMEGAKRMGTADNNLNDFGEHLDSLFAISNERLLKIFGPHVSLADAYHRADQFICNVTKSIVDLVTKQGPICFGFADLRFLLAKAGSCAISIGDAKGPKRARQAADRAIASPLLEDIDLTTAHGVLAVVSAGANLKLEECELLGEVLRSHATDDTIIVVGTVVERRMADELRIILLVTGMGDIPTNDT